MVAKELLCHHASTWSSVEWSMGLFSEVRAGFLESSEKVTEDEVEKIVRVRGP